jgi:hypothetical protein
MQGTKTSPFGKRIRIVAIAFLMVGWRLQLAFSLPVQAGPAGSEQAAARDGSHDFDFGTGAWHTHIRRVLDPFSASSDVVELNGTVTTRPT